MTLRTTRFTPLLALVLLLFADTAHAYIGPGTGFALVSSFILIGTFLILLTWPFKWAIRSFRGRRAFERNLYRNRTKSEANQK